MRIGWTVPLDWIVEINVQVIPSVLLWTLWSVPTNSQYVPFHANVCAYDPGTGKVTVTFVHEIPSVLVINR
jgi:hypothetical protein